MTMKTQDNYLLFIDGEFVRASTDRSMTTADPATGDPIAQFAAATSADVDRAVEAARESLSAWQANSPVERGRIVHRVAELVREHADDLARIESLDQGKPLAQARSDVDDAVRYFE